MKRLSQKFTCLKQDQKGGVLILVAILLVVLIGMAALTVDVGGLYLGRRQAVNAADAAALAAAFGNNENQSENAAKEYAEIINDVKFEGITFTYFGPGQSDKDTRIITVLVSKEVDFYFAPVLGFYDSDVLAMASVQQGPGNGLVPFGLIAHACNCCEVGAEPDLTTGKYDCGCSPADAVYSEYGCGCYEGGYEDTIWKILSTDGNCLKPGESMLLRWGEWQASFGPGNHGPVRLPGQKGVNSFRHDVAGGYEGTLESISPGEEIKSEPGKFGNPTGDALDDRLKMAGGECNHTIEQLLTSVNDPYECEMVVIVPMIVRKPGGGGGQSVDFEIKGYASFLLEHNMGDDGSEVIGYLVEYLIIDDLEDMFDGRDLEGFMIRLVKDPPTAREELLNNYNNN